MSFPPVGWDGQRDPWPLPPGTVPQNLPSHRVPGVEYAPDGSAYIIDLHHYARPIEGYTAVPDVTAGGLSVLLLQESDARRNYLTLRNASSLVDIYVSFGREASAQSPILLAPGQTILYDNVVPQTDMWVLASGASGFLAYSWSTIGKL